MFENSQIAKTKKILDQSGDLLIVPRIMSVRVTPDLMTAGAESVHKRKEDKSSSAMGTGDQRKKCLLLDGKVKYDGEFGVLFFLSMELLGWGIGAGSHLYQICGSMGNGY